MFFFVNNLYSFCEMQAAICGAGAKAPNCQKMLGAQYQLFTKTFKKNVICAA